LKDDLWLCFIADGHHIPFWVLKNYIALAGIERVIITTDATAAAGAKEGTYTLGDIELEMYGDRVVREPGKPNFAGSAVDMKSSETNLGIELGLAPLEIHQVLYINPLKALNIEDL
jgi:N-acetylglucosamine-6-phosphate deacetylase